ncbi:MAG: hypothetical protein HY830_08590 [Actinobacteria bacterium]|nr:hypothetical protein [Actinomycetota bacterium]
MGLPDQARRRVLVDVVSPMALWVLDLVVSSGNEQQRGILPAVGIAYAFLGYVPLVVRRRYPRAVFLVVVGHALLAPAVTATYFPTFSWWLGLYTVAATSRLAEAVGALAVASLPAAAVVATNVRDASPDHRASAFVAAAVPNLVLLAALFGVARWARWSGQRHEASRRSAEEAIAAERTRIARDLHDVVAHSVTLMLLQAGGAARFVRQDPDRAAAALAHVDTLGQQALVELRRMLVLLRPDDAPPGAGVASSPSGLTNLPSLVDRVAAGGTDARLVVEGEPRALEPGVDLTVYRIAQEALTNATRYADPAAPVEVRLRWLEDDVELEVVNRRAPGRRAAAGRPEGGGYGLVGMRERVLSVDGHLLAGPQPDGTFRVLARLPATRERAAATHG